MKATHKRIHLRTKFSIASFALSIAICAAVLFIAYQHFSQSMHSMYEERLSGIVNTAAAYVPSDRIRSYIEAAKNSSGESAEDEAYERIKEQFITLSRENHLEYLYSYHPEPDGLRVFVQGTQQGDSGHYDLGDFLAKDVDYSAEQIQMANRLLTDPDAPKTYVTESRYGNLMTVFTIVNDQSGTPYLVVGADLDIQIVQKTLSSFLRAAILTAFVILLVFQLIYQIYMRQSMINPLQQIVDGAVRFVSTAENEESLHGMQLVVRTGDEIEALADAFNQMTRDIVQYIQDINNATAERERTAADLRVATKIQSSFLPSHFPAFPDHREFDVFATMTPAREVGGDFYDFFMVDSDHLAIVIADVSGKGVPAALFMVNAKNAIKDRAITGKSPSEVFTGANEQLCDNNEAEMFVTAWMGILELSSGKLNVVNAGHNPPLIREPNGAYSYASFKAGFVLAGMEGVRYRQQEILLLPGSSIFLYTDGVTEATNAENELYGEERLLEALNAHKDMSPCTLLPEIKQSLDAFVKDAPQFDDITMLSLSYFGPCAGKDAMA